MYLLCKYCLTQFLYFFLGPGEHMLASYKCPPEMLHKFIHVQYKGNFAQHWVTHEYLNGV
jgi:hypothetical protein